MPDSEGRALNTDFKNCPIGAEMIVRVAAAEKLAAQSLDGLRSELAAFRLNVQADISEIKKTLDRHSDVLFGNGGVGIRAELQDCKGKLFQLEMYNKEAQHMANAWRMQRWGWAVAIAIGLMSAIIQLLK